MTESFSNQGATTLASAITSTGATSISVTDASSFPSSGNFRIRINDEFMLVTGGQGTTTWTVTRACEDATRFPAATHLNGAAVTQVLTVAGLAQTISDNVSGAGSVVNAAAKVSAYSLFR